MARAAVAGVSVLAVTDHDTMDGVAEARVAAAGAGVRLVPGVELSVRAPRGSMHLLGYFDDHPPGPLLDRLAGLREARERRAARMVERLAALGAPVALADVSARAAGAVGRPHVADALVAAGHAADRRDAFARYLGADAPAYVPHEALGPEEAIRLVRDGGGAPVLAHPASLDMGVADLESFVQRLGADGLLGIEVFRPDHDPERRRGLLAIARRRGLVAAGGSDFHGRAEDGEPGDTGSPGLPADAIDRLLDARYGSGS